MSGPKITDHALLRFLERAGGLDVEGIRHALADGLGRAHSAARTIGVDNYRIIADGMVWVIVDGKLVTVYDSHRAKVDRKR